MILAVSGPAHSGLFDTFNGLPAHPLIVHGAIGLVLLAAIGGVVSLVPRWRSWMLPTTAVVSVLGAISALVATESGEALERRVPHSDLIEAHAEAGEATRTLSLVLAVLLIAWWAVDRAVRRASVSVERADGADGNDGSDVRDGFGGRVATASRTSAEVQARTVAPALRIGSILLAAATFLASLAVASMLYLTGDRGAQSVWGNLPAAPASSSAPAN
jgi:uncharacterized membrane protein